MTILRRCFKGTDVVPHWFLRNYIPLKCASESINYNEATVIPFTENKAFLTDHMNTLIDEVMKASQCSEIKSFSSSKEQATRKRKLQIDNGKDHSSLKDPENVPRQKAKKKKVSGSEKRTKSKSLSVKEKEKENCLGSNDQSPRNQASAKKKSSKKDKEKAKTHAANQAALQFTPEDCSCNHW